MRCGLLGLLFLLATLSPAGAAVVTFDGIAAGTFLNSSTTLTEGEFQFTQTPNVGTDGSPVFVDVGGGNIGIADSNEPDLSGQGVLISRIDGQVFTFESIEIVNLFGVPAQINNVIRVNGYIGGVDGTLVAQDVYNVPGTPETVRAVNLLGQNIDTLEIGNIFLLGFPPNSRGNTAYSAVELRPGKTVSFDEFPEGTVIDTATIARENGFQVTQTLEFGGADGSPRLLDLGGGNLGVEDSFGGDFLGQALLITRVGGGVFTFESIDVANLTQPPATATGAVGVAGFRDGVMVASDEFFATSELTTMAAVNLLGQEVDTLRVGNINRPAPLGNSVYGGLVLVPDPADGVCDADDSIYSLDCFGIGCTAPPMVQRAQASLSQPIDGGAFCDSVNPQLDEILAPGTILIADAGAARIYSLVGFRFSESVRGTQQLFAEGEQLVSPHGVALGPDGDVWVSDVGGSFDATDDGRLVRIDSTTRLQTLVVDGVDEGTGFSLKNPVAAAFDACGNLFVVDHGDPAERDGALFRLDRRTQKLVAQIPRGGLHSPWGVAVRTDGTLVVADTELDQGFVYQLARSSCRRTQTTLSRLVGPQGSEAAIEHDGELDVLTDIRFEPGGSILVLDTEGDEVGEEGQLFRIDPEAGTITLHTSTGAPESLSRPFGLAIEPLGRILVTDRGDPSLSCPGQEDGVLVEVDPFPGVPQPTRYSPEAGCLRDETQLCEPRGLAVVPLFTSGDLVVSEPDETGGVFRVPQIALDENGEPSYAAPTLLFPACPDGDSCSDPRGVNRLDPAAVALTPTGGIALADTAFGLGSGHIVAVDPTGADRRRIVSGNGSVNYLIHPAALSITRSGDLLVLDTGGTEPVLIEIDPITGVQTCLADEAAPPFMDDPDPGDGQATEDDSGKVYIASRSQGKVLRKDRNTGETEELDCSGPIISKPTGIKYDERSGKLMVTDSGDDPGLFELSLEPCVAKRVTIEDEGVAFSKPGWISPRSDDGEILIADSGASTLIRFKDGRTKAVSALVGRPKSVDKVANPLPRSDSRFGGIRDCGASGDRSASALARQGGFEAELARVLDTQEASGFGHLADLEQRPLQAQAEHSLATGPTTRCELPSRASAFRRGRVRRDSSRPSTTVSTTSESLDRTTPTGWASRAPPAVRWTSSR